MLRNCPQPPGSPRSWIRSNGWLGFPKWHEAKRRGGPHGWATLTPANDSEEKSLSSHLRHLSKSLNEAEPYRIAADALRLAWTHGRTAAAIEREQEKRQEIADDLAPLKQLGNLAEAQARNAITELSGRISAIHSATYIVDRLKFQETSLDKKTGLSVRGQLGENMRIDATLIANTSWLRGILWAFIHALREEAVEQIGGDVFPVIMLDDPQQTFDSEHRARMGRTDRKASEDCAGGTNSSNDPRRSVPIAATFARHYWTQRSHLLGGRRTRPYCGA